MERLAKRAGIAFETVFSTDEKVDFLRRASADGYFSRVFFVGTSDPRINASRVAGRVMQGGHTAFTFTTTRLKTCRRVW